MATGYSGIDMGNTIRFSTVRVCQLQDTRMPWDSVGSEAKV